MDEFACTKCMWTGKTRDFYEKDGYPNILICPDCHSEIERIQHEFLPYEEPFNWNKK